MSILWRRNGTFLLRPPGKHSKREGERMNFNTYHSLKEINEQIINPKLSGFKPQQTHEYHPKWSNNILQHANHCPIIAVLIQFGNKSHDLHLIPFYPWNSQKNIWYMVKNTLTWTRLKSSSLTRPENILKNVSRSLTGFGPVQSSPVRRNSGFRLPRRSSIHLDMILPKFGWILIK